ncbi:MAG: sulfatase [Prevotella sp.]|nr:sulfatase [Prevotella sp.]
MITNKKILLYGLGSSCLVLGIIRGEEKRAEEGKPNVLFIIMDDMCDWANYLGGNNQVITPNLDRLAQRAVNFSNGYTAVPLSNPSRAALLSGIQPFVSGIYDNDDPIQEHPVVNNSVFMPQHFRSNGYKTIAAGKIFHTKPSASIMSAMWDDMANIDGGYGPYVQNTTLPPYLQDKMRDFQAWTGPDTDFPDVKNSQKIINFLKQSHDKPFFAAMGFYRPHNPWTAPKRYFDMYDITQIQRPYTVPNDLDDIPPYAIQNFIGAKGRERHKYIAENGNYWEQYIQAYLACVTFADDRLGMLLDALDGSAYANNTWIVLIGDNGFHHGEKERWAKSALWREANHVPFLIAPPKENANYKPGKCNTPVSLIDLYPTLIDLCGLPPVTEGQLVGNSIVPLIENTDAVWNKPAISTFKAGNFVIHQNQWNYIRYNNGSQELYNIDEDENEIFNKAGDPNYQFMVDSLAKFLPSSWYDGAEEVVVDSISEDFSGGDWDTAFNLYNPDYADINKNAAFVFPGVNVDAVYLEKYRFGGMGAIQGFVTKPSPVAGVTHDNGNGIAVAFRFRNTDESYMEFPTLSSAGKIDLYVRNNNATTPAYLDLQQFEDEWTTIHTFAVNQHNLYSSNYLDELLSYDVHSMEPIKLRISRNENANVFVNLFRLDVSPYGSSSGIAKTETPFFKQIGRKLIFFRPTNIFLYNMLGIVVYESVDRNEIDLPPSLGNGFFIVKSNNRTQKIFI